ncbi:damage-inducible protein [Macrococcoides goetzii]|nr:DnaB-like helicase C-terminal domain-containing protein [Macrococcus goetzii]TDM48245.1 damage-inducible protein [Macrococcus goetzii]
MINEVNVEYMVMGALLKYPELYSEYTLKQEMFNDPYAFNFAKHVSELGKVDKKDLYLEAKKHEDKFIPTKLIKSLLNDNLIMKSHFTQYQLEVLELYKSRKLTEATQNYTNEQTRESKDYLKSTMEYLDNLQVKKSNEKQTIVDSIADTILNGKRPNIMKTGYRAIDNYIKGFKAGQLVVVGARPALGKTAFALNMAMALENNGANVTVFSLEMPGVDIVNRMLSAHTLVNLEKFDEPDALSEQDIEKIIVSLEKFNKSNINIIADPKVTPADVRREAMKMSEESEKNVILIDYLTLMKSDTSFKDNRRLEVEDISRKLKILALEFKCTVIALSQLSRGVESRNDKRPMMSDLREAGGIEQDADMVFMLHREDYYDQEKVDDVTGISELECIITKNRNGATGTAKLQFYKKIQRFYDVN